MECAQAEGVVLAVVVHLLNGKFSRNKGLVSQHDVFLSDIAHEITLEVDFLLADREERVLPDSAHFDDSVSFFALDDLDNRCSNNHLSLLRREGDLDLLLLLGS